MHINVVAEICEKAALWALIIVWAPAPAGLLIRRAAWI